jgi:4Fe-4S ferredoxin
MYFVEIYINIETICVINTQGVHMPKHIASGLKYLAAVELTRDGYSQKEISQMLNIDRSTLSHYLHGRNLSISSIEIAELIKDFNPKDFLVLTDAVIEDKEATKTIVKTILNKKFKIQVKDTCIGCGVCVETCLIDAIMLDNLKAQIDPKLCCGCLMCEEKCPTNSIKIWEE